MNLVGVFILSASILIAAGMMSRRSTEVEASESVMPVVAEYDTVALPVPMAYVPAGTKLREVHFKQMRFPAHQIPPGALLSIDGLEEAVAIAALPANLPLFRENLNIGVTLTNPVIERIPQGMRAMTIRVDETSAVEGWAGSGSIVDVLLVQSHKTSVIAERVKILSAERSVAPVEGAASPTVPSTVTLLVTQDQCLAINTAIPLGKIAFALRSTKDEEGWSSTAFTAESLRGGPRTPEARNSISGFARVEDREGGRSFALTDEIDDEKAGAKFENGVLELTLPKKAVAGAKRLSIQ